MIKYYNELCRGQNRFFYLSQNVWQQCLLQCWCKVFQCGNLLNFRNIIPISLWFRFGTLILIINYGCSLEGGNDVKKLWVMRFMVLQVLGIRWVEGGGSGEQRVTSSSSTSTVGWRILFLALCRFKFATLVQSAQLFLGIWLHFLVGFQHFPWANISSDCITKWPNPKDMNL